VADDVALTANYTYRSEDLTTISDSIDQHIVMVGASIKPFWSGK
jgi:hypothetical protein